ncbi:MAG: putative DNA-binding domain-containing protein, partial [Methylococcales bacterium]|nr:putative DNA-binding domain-containing protein [Methylococcales bacterium]
MNDSPPTRLSHWQAYLTGQIRATGDANIADNPRLACYRELCRHNLESFLANTFPICKNILPGPDWSYLVQHFFAESPLTTPYFAKIPEAFLAYLQNTSHSIAMPPFLVELAHYEWVEMALTLAQHELPAPSLGDDLLQQPVQLSPLAWPLIYRFPVQRIGRSFQPDTPLEEPTCLLVYRDRADQVHFNLSNPLTYRLLTWLEQHPGTTLAKALHDIAPQLDRHSP